MSGEVREVWGAYHERERLCPEGVRVREIAHVHYADKQTDTHPRSSLLSHVSRETHVSRESQSGGHGTRNWIGARMTR